MNEALLEIMKPIIEPALLQQVQQSIRDTIKTLRDLGHHSGTIEFTGRIASEMTDSGSGIFKVQIHVALLNNL